MYHDKWTKKNASCILWKCYNAMQCDVEYLLLYFLYTFLNYNQNTGSMFLFLCFSMLTAIFRESKKGLYFCRYRRLMESGKTISAVFSDVSKMDVKLVTWQFCAFDKVYLIILHVKLDTRCIDYKWRKIVIVIIIIIQNNPIKLYRRNQKRIAPLNGFIPIYD